MADDTLERLITAVGEHYAKENDPPLLLSTSGQKNRVLLIELKDRFGSLMAAVKTAGEDRLKFIDTLSDRPCLARECQACSKGNCAIKITVAISPA